MGGKSSNKGARNQTGEIKLISREGNLIAMVRYQNKNNRNVIIERWSKLYGSERFKHQFIQINPDIKEKRDEYLDRKIQRSFKKPILCQQIRLNTFMLQTSAQYKTQS